MATLRALRPVPDPLGSYFRPGRRDGKFMLQMMVEGKFKGSGLVVDPCLRARQSDLVQEGLRQKIEVVLDPRSVELSTPGGFSRSGVSDLAWASRDLHKPSDWTGAAGLTAVNHLVDAVQNEGYSAVLAPTHVLDGPDSPWWSVDLIAVRQLRDALDARGLGKVLIYHPLVTRAPALLRNPSWRLRIIEDLGSAPIDALWLRVHPFGTATSGPLALRRYLELCRELHGLKVPLVAERSGAVGVALLAFGAVGGIESGVTIGERVDLDPYLRPPDPNSNGFSPPPPRVPPRARRLPGPQTGRGAVRSPRDEGSSWLPGHRVLPAGLARCVPGASASLHNRPNPRGCSPVPDAGSVAARSVHGEFPPPGQRRSPPCSRA